MTGKGPESGPERGSAKGTQKKNRKGETDEQIVRTRVRKRDIQLNHALTVLKGQPNPIIKAAVRNKKTRPSRPTMCPL